VKGSSLSSPMTRIVIQTDKNQIALDGKPMTFSLQTSGHF